MIYAHAAHWITSVVYMLPIVAFLLWLVFINVRDRLSQRDD